MTDELFDIRANISTNKSNLVSLETTIVGQNNTSKMVLKDIYKKFNSVFKKTIFTAIASSIFLLPITVCGELYYRNVAKKERPWVAENYSTNDSTLSDYVVRTHIPGIEFFIPPNSHNPREEKMNSWGYHDDDFIVPKPRDVFRIVILGDSMTYGTSYYRNLTLHKSQAYPNRLEQILNENRRDTRKRFDVINLGVPAYQTTQCYSTMKHIVMPLLEPDLIIYAFYGNDVWDTNYLSWKYGHKYKGFCFDDDIPFKHSESSVFGDFIRRTKLFFETNSSLYSELEYRTTLFRYEFIIPIIKKIYSNLGNGYAKQSFGDLLLLVPYFYPGVPMCPDYLFTSVAIGEMSKLAKENNTNFMVFNISFPSLSSVVTSKEDVDPLGFFPDEHFGILVYSPYQYVRNYTRRESLNLKDLRIRLDEHPSALGHDILARSLYSYLGMHKELLGEK